MLLVRNPYYHHVDTASNQLPYVDRLEITHVGDKQLYDLNASAGEADAFKQAATGTADAARLGKAYFAFFADELPMIPTIGLAPHPVIIHNRLKNVPADNIFWGSDTNFYAPYKPEQWFIAQ